MRQAAALHRLLGDEARLRLLRLLAAERLNVTELTGILGIAQSGVSRHLGLLKESGLVAEAREGGYAYYRLAPGLRDGANGLGPLRALLDAQFAAFARTPAVRADEARLQEVLRLRKENVDAHAGPDARARQLVPGRSWAAWSRALGRLLPPLRVADLGCGEGYLAIEAARWAREVVAIDRSDAVLRRARALARRRRVSNIVWKRGEIERVPLAGESVDVALLSQALHHAGHPARALAEAARIVRPGGRVLVLDLRAHDERWVAERLGDRWLGFDDAELDRLLKGAGLEDVRVGVGARKTGDPFTVLVASGVKAGGDLPPKGGSHIRRRDRRRATRTATSDRRATSDERLTSDERPATND
jgi:ArsR family transcriptional regulator